jgi:hypothetical protein
MQFTNEEIQLLYKVIKCDTRNPKLSRSTIHLRRNCNEETSHTRAKQLKTPGSKGVKNLNLKR